MPLVRFEMFWSANYGYVLLVYNADLGRQDIIQICAVVRLYRHVLSWCNVHMGRRDIKPACTIVV